MATQASGAAPSAGWRPVVRDALARALPLVGLYLLALAVRLAASAQIPVSTTEVSAYYADVAANLASGNGLVSHSVWSYATGPLVVPKPAFELWLPMSSFVSALAMSILGQSWWAAQVGGALLGSLVAPLAWAVAHGAAHALDLDARRAGAVAAGSGILAALFGPLVLASAVPDSYMPYLVFSLMAVLVVPRWLGIDDGALPSPARAPTRLAGVTLGILLGCAYLSRQEAIWMGLTVLLWLAWALRSRPPSTRRREALLRTWPVVLGGLLVVVPWLARNSLEFGSPFPGQALENMVLVRNEDIFAYAQRPDLASYLDQGLTTVLTNPLAALWAGLVEVLLLPAVPVGAVGLVALIAMRRSPALRRPTSLAALLASGFLVLASTVLLFPVATRWGTFLHASGPLLVGLLVMAVFGMDALLARVSAWRHWRQPNVILGPTRAHHPGRGASAACRSAWSPTSRVSAKRATPPSPGPSRRSPTMMGRLSRPPSSPTIRCGSPRRLERDAIALPDEDLASVAALSRRFEAPWLVIVDERGRYPASLLAPAARACLAGPPVALEPGSAPAWLVRLSDDLPGRVRAGPGIRSASTYTPTHTDRRDGPGGDMPRLASSSRERRIE